MVAVRDAPALANIGGAQLILKRDDVTGALRSVRLEGARQRTFRFTLLDPVTERPVLTHEFSPGDGEFTLPAAGRALRYQTKTLIRPFDGAEVPALAFPLYRVDLVA
jgi:hypothetical protein